MAQRELYNFAHGVGQNAFHFVWKPKYAWDTFKFPWVQKDCTQILRGIAQRHGMQIYELEVMPDHVHLFAEIPPSMSVSKALQLLKGASAYELFRKHPWLRSYFRKGHFWSPGKFFRSVGSVTAENIKRYIAESNRGWKHQQLLIRYPAL
jgi:putative transposase